MYHTQIIFTKNTFTIVKILFKIGFLKNYLITYNKKTLKKSIKFSFFFYKNVTFFSKIRLISTPAKKIFISLNALHKLNKSVGMTVFILSTSQGLITHKEAIKRKTGGILLLLMA